MIKTIQSLNKILTEMQLPDHFLQDDFHSEEAMEMKSFIDALHLLQQQ